MSCRPGPIAPSKLRAFDELGIRLAGFRAISPTFSLAPFC